MPITYNERVESANISPECATRTVYISLLILPCLMSSLTLKGPLLLHGHVFQCVDEDLKLSSLWTIFLQ